MSRKRYLNNQIVLSVVALLVVLVLGVSITFSWIEGGTTYSIQTENSGDVKTQSELTNNEYNGTVYLNPDSTTTLDLLKYDNTTYDYINNQKQTVFFSPVSSKDGKNFYFPINMEGQTTAYRSAITNDYGSKFVSFDFDVKASKKCFLAFSGAPEISVTKNGSAVTDTSAFRIMISDGTAAGTHIFSTGGAVTTQVVAGLSGTTPSMTSLTTEAFDNYLNVVDKTQKLYTYNKNATGNIQVSIWLDESADTSILGGDVSITLKLDVVAEDVVATFNAVSYNKSGTKLTNGFTGGSIKYGDTTHTSSFTVSSTTFSATAVPATGYEFIGWYRDATCTDLVTTSTSLLQSPEEDVTYYAKFQESSKTVIYVEERSGFSTYSVYAYKEVGSTTTHYSGIWPGDSATLDSETGYYKYEFTTTDTGEFMVIISNSGSSQYPGVDEDGLIGTLGGTYLFTADNTLIEFDPADMITVKASASTGGSAYVDGVSSVKILSGDSVALKANVSSGYRFVGWYKDSSYSTTIGSTYATANQTITVTGTAGSTITYYAKFEKIPVLTVKTSVTPSGYGSATVNGSTSVSSIQSGTSVTLNATANSGYEFVGWFTNSACTTAIDTNYETASRSYTVTGTDGATVTLYAKFQVKSESTTTIYFAPRSGFSNYYAWVWNDTTGTNYTSAGSWPGDQATFDNTTGCYKYTFTTAETGTFKVIVSDGNGNQYPSSGGLSGTIGGTYLFDGTSLSTFSSSSVVTITFNASSTTWVAEQSAIMYMEDTSTGYWYKMTRTSSSSYTWTANVVSSVTNINFYRRNSAHTTTWNSWSAGSRGSKVTYKTSGDGAGSWQ